MAGATKKETRKAEKRHEEATSVSAVTAAARAMSDAPPLFFCLDRARFYDPLRITKVIVVQLPVQHIRSKGALHELVLKKLLHRPYALSAEDSGTTAAAAEAAAQTGPAARRTRQRGSSTDRPEPFGETTGTAVAASMAKSAAAVGTSSSSGQTPAATATATVDPYVVVNIDSIEPHADTVRQVNAKGDLRLNLMLTLTVARVHHGVLAGRCFASAYENCMQVTLPCPGASLTRDETQATATSNRSHKRARSPDKAADVKDIDDTIDADTTRAGAEGTAAHAEAESESPDELRITVRCAAEEPVVSGQAVLVVSEPGGSIRCMAIRPPRRAPGPFRLLDADEAERGQRGSQRGGKAHGGGARGVPVAAGAVQVVCDVPPKGEVVEAGRKMGGGGKGPQEGH